MSHSFPSSTTSLILFPYTVSHSRCCLSISFRSSTHSFPIIHDIHNFLRWVFYSFNMTLPSLVSFLLTLMVRYTKWQLYRTFYHKTFTLFISSEDTNGKIKCTLNLLYPSLASDELVVLQDKLLHSSSDTTLHRMSAENSKWKVEPFVRT